MSVKRNKDARLFEDSHSIDNLEYNECVGARKIVEVGPALEYIGDASGGIQVEKGDALYILNLSGAIGYIAIDDSAPAAPTVPADNVFPVFDSGEFVKYSVGSNAFIRTSAATLHIYKLVDTTVVRVNP